jgi:hypothetical protein
MLALVRAIREKWNARKIRHEKWFAMSRTGEPSRGVLPGLGLAKAVGAAGAPSTIHIKLFSKDNSHAQDRRFGSRYELCLGHNRLRSCGFEIGCRVRAQNLPSRYGGCWKSRGHGAGKRLVHPRLQSDQRIEARHVRIGVEGKRFLCENLDLGRWQNAFTIATGNL